MRTFNMMAGVIASVILASPAFANGPPPFQGGDTTVNNTNNNVPIANGGAGGAGGKGGTGIGVGIGKGGNASVRSNNTNVNANTNTNNVRNTNTNRLSNRQNQHQRQNQSQSLRNKNSSNSGGNSFTVTDNGRAYASPPSMSAYTNHNCALSYGVSGGNGIVSAGISFTRVDKGCDQRAWIALCLQAAASTRNAELGQSCVAKLASSGGFSVSKATASVTTYRSETTSRATASATVSTGCYKYSAADPYPRGRMACQ